MITTAIVHPPDSGSADSRALDSRPPSSPRPKAVPAHALGSRACGLGGHVVVDTDRHGVE
eukprot:3188242-Prymnesium_polylepis.1